MPVHRIGFTQLPGSGDARGGPYRVNIVFVHGVRGHPQHTWEDDRPRRPETSAATPRKKRTLKSWFRAKSSPTVDALIDEASSSQPKVFWPDEYLTHNISDARVWTYGYNADAIGFLFQANNQNSINQNSINQNSISQHGQDLAVSVERDIENELPILFVAHSLGGIIVKDAMHRSKACRTRTKLIVFLGTPHRGSQYAGWGEIAVNLAQIALQDSNKKIIKTLKVNSEVLDNIHDRFKTIAHEDSIKIHSLQEARGISGMKGLHNKVVDDFSSKLDLPQAMETVESMDANHMQMARCKDRSDPQYRAICGVLMRFLRGGTLGSSTLAFQQNRQLEELVVLRGLFEST